MGAALMPTDPCTDVAASLYDTPAGLPAFTTDVRGTLLGCALLDTISDAQLRTRLATVTDARFSGGSVRRYLVAYRTEREPRGVGGISTALVYLPDVAISDRVPLVLAAHGSVGLADDCAPSINIDSASPWLPASYMDALYLAWAARGLPVVAPDYAGLGTEGVHGYGNWVDGARSAIDGVRALRSLLDPSRLDGRTLVYGHSQGGGIALAVAAYASEAPDVSLSAVVAMAPGYRVISEVNALRLTTTPVTPLLVATIGMTLYADLANLGTDPAHYGDALAAPVRDTLVTDFTTLCYGPAITAVGTPSTGYTPPAIASDALDSSFAMAAITCADTGTCTGSSAAWVARDVANDPHLSASAPPILVTGSAGDEQVTPGVLGCALQALRHDHAAYDFCTVPSANHLGVVTETTSYALDWALAASSGAERPPCSASTTVPACRLL